MLASFCHLLRGMRSFGDFCYITDVFVYSLSHWCREIVGFPGGSDHKESACSAIDECSLLRGHFLQEDPLEKGMAPHSSILA